MDAPITQGLGVFSAKKSQKTTGKYSTISPRCTYFSYSFIFYHSLNQVRSEECMHFVPCIIFSFPIRTFFLYFQQKVYERFYQRILVDQTIRSYHIITDSLFDKSPLYPHIHIYYLLSPLSPPPLGFFFSCRVADPYHIISHRHSILGSHTILFAIDKSIR